MWHRHNRFRVCDAIWLLPLLCRSAWGVRSFLIRGSTFRRRVATMVAPWPAQRRCVGVHGRRGRLRLLDLAGKHIGRHGRQPCGLRWRVFPPGDRRADVQGCCWQYTVKRRVLAVAKSRCNCSCVRAQLPPFAQVSRAASQGRSRRQATTEIVRLNR